MQEIVAPGLVRTGRLVYSVILCILALTLVLLTLHWRWMWDDSVMHYVNFLMDHGMVLYRDIVDMNMPGSYFIEGTAIHLFGGGDVAARCYEYFLLVALTGSMIVIAWPYDWFAGLFAGVLFALMHASEGPINSVQREEIMTVLMMASFALVFLALRRRVPMLLLPFGFLTGLATSLKPTAAPLGLVVLAMVALALRRRKEPSVVYLAYGAAGLLAAGAVVVAFFLRTHAFPGFLDSMRRLLPFYATMHQAPYADMLRSLMGRAMLVLLPPAMLLTAVHRDWRNWERWALAFGVLFGAFSYFAQHKGFLYHRYPFLAFFLLWAGLEFVRAIRQTGWVRVVGIVSLSLSVLYLGPLYAYRTAHVPHAATLPDSLERDLTDLGGPALQGKVQCLDMVSGCVTALYRLNLVQSTGFIGDMMLFQPRGVPPSAYYRDLFLKQMAATQPRVLVVTDAWFLEGQTFDKLDQWPAFEQFLSANYALRLTRSFDDPSEVIPHLAYRIYVASKPAAGS